jgi:hypothetical protein
MTLLDQLATGELGVVAVPPAHLTVEAHTPTSIKFRADEPGAGFWFLFFPSVHLDLRTSHLAQLERDAHRTARAMFDSMFAQLAAAAGPRDKDPLFDRPPRTADATWTPIIEIEPLQLGAATALSVLHRVAYQPGHETVMGHTLLPAPGGLFEARWFFSSRSTGTRESTLLIASGNPGFLQQQAYDDPVHDERFPAHPLSRARAAKRWHHGGRLRLKAMCEWPPAGPFTIDPLGCTITAPPRFLPSSRVEIGGDVACMFTRLSLSGNDGVEQLFVARGNSALRGADPSGQLLSLAGEQARVWYTLLGYTDVDCQVRPLDSATASVEVLLEARAREPGGIRRRAAAQWFLDDTGRPWWIAITSTVAVPLAEITEEVHAMVRSWHRKP